MKCDSKECDTELYFKENLVSILLPLIMLLLDTVLYLVIMF